MAKEFIIVGDSQKFKSCLVYKVGDYDTGKTTLHRMLTNPTQNDLYVMRGLDDFRIKEVVSEDQWWNTTGTN